MPGKRRIDVRLATQILLLQLAVVALTLGIAFALLAVLYHKRLISEYGTRSLDIARVLAAAPAVRADVAGYDEKMVGPEELARGPLQRISTQARQATGALFVVITTDQGIRLIGCSECHSAALRREFNRIG